MLFLYKYHSTIQYYHLEYPRTLVRLGEWRIIGCRLPFHAWSIHFLFFDALYWRLVQIVKAFSPPLLAGCLVLLFRTLHGRLVLIIELFLPTLLVEFFILMFYTPFAAFTVIFAVVVDVFRFFGEPHGAVGQRNGSISTQDDEAVVELDGIAIVRRIGANNAHRRIVVFCCS